ncbi:glycosyl hydrolase family 61-domain-containing protein [Aspergillus granulosus]|uniref:Glycosyl hydrolase family 61-domain-containing protein n=1 Tax=Aspergillus granulosus TaxID=176169 RepID=A0ABR4GRL3_9EURO
MAFPATILALAGSAAAHGFVKNININGQDYGGYLVDTYPWADAPDLIAWSTTATDTGYVEDFTGPDVICHEGGTPGPLSGEVTAGGVVTLTWNQWLSDHKGPVINYLASCNGDCANVNPNVLEFFKIAEMGYVDGVWATDTLIAQGNSWDVLIPEDIKAGGYVLRHEIIALHGAFQLYPQCINLQVKGGGYVAPAGTLGVDLYTGDEPGLNTNIWSGLEEYIIPGPPLYTEGGESAVSSLIPSTTLATTTLRTDSAPWSSVYNRPDVPCTPCADTSTRSRTFQAPTVTQLTATETTTTTEISDLIQLTINGASG